MAARCQLGCEHRVSSARAAGSDTRHAGSLLSVVIDRPVGRWNAADTVLPGAVWRYGRCPGQALRARKEVSK